MKKRWLYLLTLLLFVLAAGFVVVRYKKDRSSKLAASYLLLERKGVLAKMPEWKTVQEQYTGYMKIIKTNPDDMPSRLSLAALYIQEARVTGNYMYYDMAAMKYVDEVLARDPNDFEALIYKALIHLSQHHFAEGLAVAEKARKSNPDNAYVYGILIDGNVEMGNYTAAVAHAERMVSIRPDIRSYSRISYLREIHGDYPGAIDAMKLAVDAGAPGEEATEWARVQLGHLYEYSGDLQNAAICYKLSLEARPFYAYAIAGQARLALAAKEYQKAIGYYLQADSLVADYSFKESLVDIYRLSGKNELADSLSKLIISGMSRDAENGKKDESIGHYSDKELAYAYLAAGDTDKAMDHAIAEYNRRPDNIEVNETLAWVYYKKDNAEKALPFLNVALKTNSKNPNLLCRAGLIYAKSGDRVKGKQLLDQAIKLNPNIAETLKSETLAVLKRL